MDAGCPSVETLFEELAKRLPEGNLNRQHERVTKQQDAPFVRCLDAKLLFIPEPGAIDGDVGGELTGREARARVRLETVTDRGVRLEQSLKRWRRLGTAPRPQCDLEDAELHDGNQHEEHEMTEAHHGRQFTPVPAAL